MLGQHFVGILRIRPFQYPIIFLFLHFGGKYRPYRGCTPGALQNAFDCFRIDRPFAKPPYSLGRTSVIPMKSSPFNRIEKCRHQSFIYDNVRFRHRITTDSVTFVTKSHMANTNHPVSSRVKQIQQIMIQQCVSARMKCL